MKSLSRKNVESIRFADESVLSDTGGFHTAGNSERAWTLQRARVSSAPAAREGRFSSAGFRFEALLSPFWKWIARTGVRSRRS